MQIAVEFDRDVVADLRLDAEELRKALLFASSEVARQAQVRGVRSLQEAVGGLTKKRARSRIRVYRGEIRGLWIGGNDIRASLKFHEVRGGRRPSPTQRRRAVRSGRRVYGRGGRPVIIRGQVQPRAFVWLNLDLDDDSRYAGVPFQRLPDGRADSVPYDISEPISDIADQLRVFVPEVLDGIFRRKALQIVQTRGV